MNHIDTARSKPPGEKCGLDRRNHSNDHHAGIVENVVMGGNLAQRFGLTIRDSWRRCLLSAPLNPDRPRRPVIVAATELRRRRERTDPVYAIAQVEMAGLNRLLNAPVGVMLTDHEGVILSYVGDARFTEVAHGSGLREGAVWSEAEQGTNGMGTCLVMREPVLIKQDEHFLAQNTALTCCGAPILDGRGHLVGALNISGRLQLSPEPTLALVKLAVQNIENRAMLEQYRQQRLLRFHPHREFIATAGEGILALDDDGNVVAANRGALDWLNVANHADLCGQSVEQLVGLDMNRLEALARHPEHARPLPQRDTGLLCYGILQTPQVSPMRGTTQATSSDNALLRAECETLRELLESCHWNVSLAATQLNISRRTLHRKLKAHGLRRYSVY